MKVAGLPADLIKVAKPRVDEEEVPAVREVLLAGGYVSGTKVRL